MEAKRIVKIGALVVLFPVFVWVFMSIVVLFKKIGEDMNPAFVDHPQEHTE